MQASHQGGRAPPRLRGTLAALALGCGLGLAVLGLGLTAMAQRHRLEAEQHRWGFWTTLQTEVEAVRFTSVLTRAAAGDPTLHRLELPVRLEDLTGRVRRLSQSGEPPGPHPAQSAMLATLAAIEAGIGAPPDQLWPLVPLAHSLHAPLHEMGLELHALLQGHADGSAMEQARRMALLVPGTLALLGGMGLLAALLGRGRRRAGRALGAATAAEAEARQDAIRLRSLIDAVPALVTSFDSELRYVLVNRAVQDFFGRPEGQLVGRRPTEAGLPPEIEADLRRVRETGQAVGPIERVVRDCYGDSRCLLSTAIPVFDAQGRLHQVLRTGLDVTQHRRTELRARQLAERDILTDLPNRHSFNQELTASLAANLTGGWQAGLAGSPSVELAGVPPVELAGVPPVELAGVPPVELASVPPVELALHLVDLDGFRTVNDMHGEAMGDALLRAMARRMAGLVRPQDMLGRLGGDKFAVLQRIRSAPEAETLAARITQALAQPYQLGALVVRCSASLGVAAMPPAGLSAEAMLAQAKYALNQAQREGPGRFMAFRPEMESEAMIRRALQTELTAALAAGTLHLAYQPKFCLLDGRLEGVEALLRWDHPVRGAISPAEFVPLAEEAGLALPLAHFVLYKAAAQIKAWQAQGLEMPVAVNLSGELIGMPEALALVEAVLAETGIPTNLLEIEVTESTFIGDSKAAKTILLGLRALGIRVALDDFGTGFSSLAYLQELPIDVLKVDRSFVQGLGQREASARIVDTVVRLAHGLGARVVAEGVETHEQLEALRNLGCDAVQGFLLARPQPAEAIAALLTAPISGLRPINQKPGLLAATQKPRLLAVQNTESVALSA